MKPGLTKIELLEYMREESQNYDELDDLSTESEELYERHRILVDKGQTFTRIDKFLCDRIENASRNQIQKAAGLGMVTVNGQAVKSNYKVKPLDEIIIYVDTPPINTEVVPEPIPLDIAFEDDYLLVVNKPAGLVVHPGHGNWRGTLVNGLAWYLKENPNYDPNDPRVGLVHRIDKDTSGLLLIAKTPEAKANLSMQFFHKTTKREYRALVWGNVEQDEGTIEGNIGRNPSNRLQMKVFEDSSIGKDAVTHYRVVERFGYVTLIACRLETGRTHQIRVHMQHIGHPLFNDERYGGNKILRGERHSKYKQFIDNCFAICPRQALHAMSLGFVHPNTNEEILFTSSLPDDMNVLVDKWKKYISNRKL